MSKVKIHEFDLGIYPRKIWIAITTENKFDGFSELSEMDESVGAVTEHAYNNETKKGGIFIRFAKRNDMSAEYISHEACHAALGVLEYIGANVEFSNQEPFCYLVGYISKCCEQVKNNKFKEG